jgi:ABC-type multidrug transport system ATPase subunit/MFS family permease
MSETKPVLWNRNFVQCCISYFLMNFAFYMLMPTMPVYLVEELGISTSEVGMVLSSYTIGLLCVRPFSGYLVDCFSRKPLYVFAFTIFACLFAGYWFAMTVYTIMAVRFIQGGFMGLTSVSGNTITIDVIPSKRRGEGMGFYGLTINLAMSLAPLVAVGLYDRHGFFWIIGVALVIALVGIGSVGLIRYPKREKVPRPAFSLDRFILVKALPAALAYLLVAIPYGMLLSFVVLYGKEIEVPDPGYFFIFMAIGVGTARLISGRLVDHGKIHVVSIVSLVSLAISFSVFATVHTSFVFFACALAIGIGFGVSVPAFQCLFVNVAPHHMRGTATSTYLTSFDFGMGIGMLSAGFIATRANAVILVSHDRAFIDNTTFRTLEIELGKVYDYKVKYSEYVVLRQERREQQQRAYENQQKKLADTEAFIERFRYKATKSVQVQSRIKQLEKVERIEVDDVDTAMLRLKFPPAPRSGSYPVICEEVAKRYGDHLIFDHVTLTINRGDKVAFVGKNGEGKSTLVKCIMGEIADFTGKLQLGHNVKIGYFAQNQAQLLNENLTVFDTIDYVAQGDIRLKIRDILGAFMFGGEASDKKVKVLSGGERTRLAMIRLLLEPVNLLILDEPTNHLDMRSKDVLKDALREFDGTVILVSHDREFLDGLVDKVYEFGNQKVVEHLGGIYNFLEHKKMDSLRELERSTGTSTSTSGTGEAQVSQNKLSYEARKELSKAIKKAEKVVAEAEARISELENGIAVIEAKLATPEGASDASLYGEYSALKKELSDAMDLWTERTMELEELNTQDS